MKKILFLFAFVIFALSIQAQTEYDTVAVYDPQAFTEMTTIDPANGQIISRKNSLNRRVNFDTLRNYVTPSVTHAWLSDPLDSTDVLSSYWRQFVTDSLGRVWYVDADGDAKMLKDTAMIGVSDGDKGDIDVTSSGVTWNIDTAVVGPIELASTAVTPGSYTNTSLTVDADGRITAASNGAAIDSSIYKLLPLGDVTILADDNTLSVLSNVQWISSFTPGVSLSALYVTDSTYNATSLTAAGLIDIDHAAVVFSTESSGAEANYVQQRGNISLQADTLDVTNVTTLLGFPSGGSTPSIRNDLPTESVTIDPNNFDLQIGTAAANNTGEFEVVTLTAAGRDAILYVGSADSTTAPIPAEGVLMSHVTAGEVGGVAVNYEYLGDIYNAVIFGDSVLISKWAGDTLQLFLSQLPITGSSGKYVMVEDPSTGRISRVLASSFAGADDQNLTSSRDTILINDGTDIRTPGPAFLRDSITGAALTINLKTYNQAIVEIRMESCTSTTLTINNPWSATDIDATYPTFEGETGVYSFHFLGISGTDNITWPADFLDMNGTALGTDALTTGTMYTCYRNPVSAKYYCK